MSKASALADHKDRLVAALKPRPYRSRSDLELALELETEFRCWLSREPQVPNPNPVWERSKRQAFVGLYLLGRHHAPVPY